MSPRTLFGFALLLSAYVPFHRLLDPALTGPAGVATRAISEAAWSIGVAGTLIVVSVAWLAVRLIPERRVPADRAAEWMRILSIPGRSAFALFVGVITVILAGSVAWLVHHGAPTSVDEMAQLLHARAVAGGRLTIPLVGSDAAWLIQNGVVTDFGWASIYPPAHTLILASAFLMGVPWMVGPVAIGVATALVGLSAERLIGTGPGRSAAILLAVSPFWLLLGSTQLSHSTAAMALALVLWTGLRAREGATHWSVATGAAVGLAVGVRPWTGIVCSVAILTTLWYSQASASTHPKARWLTRLSAVAVGGLPFAVLLFWWNATLFGNPLRLGYSAAFGPSHGLGFGVDPWGNQYGVLEAIGYTGADLGQLGIRLFESPIPALALIGAALVARPLRKGTHVFVAWALGAVAANSVYWHHGIHMGPRMLLESAPAWVVLLTASVATLFGTAPQNPSTTPVRVARWSAGLGILGGILLAPGAFQANAGAATSAGRPSLPVEEAVVFVHGSWASRISSRLAASGMRRDSIETALRRNDICAVDRYSRWRRAPDGAGTAPPLDLEPRPGSPATMESLELSSGNFVRIRPGASPDATCLREARADRLGVLELEFLAWRFPPLDGVPLIVARDLGPVGNFAVLNTIARPAYLYIDTGLVDGPLLLGYTEGMELLWGGAAGAERQ